MNYFFSIQWLSEYVNVVFVKKHHIMYFINTVGYKKVLSIIMFMSNQMYLYFEDNNKGTPTQFHNINSIF